eukprot:scaffold112151_cov61-Phaeocystis_antarctica.AAC.2
MFWCPRGSYPGFFQGLVWWALGLGLASRALPVKFRAEDRTIPQDGSGETARAWSPAWDTNDRSRIPACNGFQPG